MMSTKKLHSQKNISPNQTNHFKTQQTHRDVRQDKGAPKCARVASRQPVPRENMTRAHPMNRDFTRTQSKLTSEQEAVCSAKIPMLLLPP